METWKLILTFIADMIHYIAWPAVVITMFVLVRHPIKALIDKITDIIFKKGDAELRVNIAKVVKAITEEKPGVIPLAGVTPETLNWETFISVVDGLQWTLAAFLMEQVRDPDTIRAGIRTIEEICLLRKDDMPVDDVARLQEVLRRLARILDNPS